MTNLSLDIRGIHTLRGGARVDAPDEFEPAGLYHSLVSLLLGRWRLIALCTMILATTCAIQLATVSPLFRATSKIQITPGSERVLPYENLPKTTEEYYATDAYIRTLKEVLESEALANRVLDGLDLTDDPTFNNPPSSGFLLEASSAVFGIFSNLLFMSQAGDDQGARAKAIKLLTENLDVELPLGTRLLEVHYSFHDADLAAKITNSYVSELVEMDVLNRNEAASKAQSFLRGQLVVLKEQLEESESRLVNYARRNGILDIDKNQEVVLNRLRDLSQELTRVESSLIALRAQQRILENASVDSFPESLVNPKIENLQERLSQVEQKLASLSGRFGKNWPSTLQAEKEREALSREVASVKMAAIEQAKLDYQVGLDHYQMLSERLQRQNQFASNVDSSLIEFNMLRREMETNQSLYEGILQRLKETNVAAALQTSHLRILEEGRSAHSPVWPHKTQFMAIAIVLGLLLGFGMAVFLESLDTTFRTPTDSERFLDVSCLAVVPAMAGLTAPLNRKRLTSGRGNDAGSPAVCNGYGSRSWEAFRLIRTSILHSDLAGPVQTVLVTSALPGEGKTTVAVNTALSLAQSGARTLLIDLNLRNAALSRLFDLPDWQGLSNFLSDQTDLTSQISPTLVDNLFVLPAGPQPSGPIQLIDSPRTSYALGLLGQFFDAIVIDTPPLLHSGDALVLSSQADGLIFVIEGGKTLRQAVRKAFSYLKQADARILGTVINNVDVRRPEYSYDYGARTQTLRGWPLSHQLFGKRGVQNET